MAAKSLNSEVLDKVIGPEVWRASNLDFLDLSAPQLMLDSLDGILDLGIATKSILYLNLSKNRLSEVDSYFTGVRKQHFSSTQTLLIDDNRLQSFAADLPQLRTLSLNNNYLTSIPTLKGIPNLKVKKEISMLVVRF